MAGPELLDLLLDLGAALAVLLHLTLQALRTGEGKRRAREKGHQGEVQAVILMRTSGCEPRVP